MAKVINIKDYLGRPKKKPVGRPIDVPEKVVLWLEVDQDDPTAVLYDCSDDRLLESSYGKQLLAWWLGNITCDLCAGLNPELIVQLQQALENYGKD